MKSGKIIFTTVLSALVCFGLLAGAHAVGPAAPDTALPGGNTADGQSALGSLTTGQFNSAFGFLSLLSNADANFNTGVGAGVLLVNTASENTAVGAGALFSNVDGSDNNAVGTFALFSNVSGSFNNAHGRDALLNSTGDQNNAMGDDAMFFNTTGSFNTAVGDDALDNNVDGNSNVAIGDEAGSSLGPSVNNCIAIGAPGAGPFATFDNTCFIGSIFGQAVSDPATQVPVFVDQFNNVGVFNTSSRKLKHDIQPMDKASETLYQFKPVTFKYNSDWKGTTQYGLIAEEVAEVDPQLVVHGKNGEVMAVHYEQINNMLLNEFLKEHKKVEAQQATIAELKSSVAQQQKGMAVLTAQLKEQAAQIQKVSAQLEVRKPAAKVVLRNP
jgi:Chaperone of endosialidase